MEATILEQVQALGNLALVVLAFVNVKAISVLISHHVDIKLIKDKLKLL